MQNEKAPSAKVARDIQERTFNFGVRVIKLVGRLPRTIAANALAQQLIRSGTSIGANMQEAEAAESKADFIHKIGIALKEARETHYWLKLLQATLLAEDSEIQALVQEAHELSLIIGAIKRNAVKNKLSQSK